MAFESFNEVHEQVVETRLVDAPDQGVVLPKPLRASLYVAL